MGSLNNGVIISQDSNVVRNLGNEIIDISSHLTDSTNREITSFTPDKINSLYLWLDASDASTLTYGIDNKVSSWTDKSTNNFGPLVQSTADSKPTFTLNRQNGRPGIVFTSASNQHLLFDGTIGLTLPFCVFVVALTTTSAASQSVFWVGDKDHAEEYRRLSFRGSTSFISWSARAGAQTSSSEQFATTTATYIVNTPYILYGEDASAISHKVRLNGENEVVNTVNRPINNSDRIAIGMARDSSPDWPLNGEIYEVLVFNGSLSNLERAKVENYLAVKWGVTLDG